MSDAVARKPRRSAESLGRDCRAAVLREVAEVGFGRLTIEGVAKRAGVAKTSLYRHWESVEDLLLDALSDAHPREEPTTSGGTLRDDLVRALNQLCDWLDGPTSSAVAAIMGERERRPDLVQALWDRVFDINGGRFTRRVLEFYAGTGDLDGNLLTPVVLDIGEALVIKHMIDTGTTPDQQTLANIVDQAILPAVGHAPHIHALRRTVKETTDV